jgi:hypothetical protein
VAAESGFCGQRGMASWCLYLSTPKGQAVALTLCTKAASAFAMPVFNLFCLWGTCRTILGLLVIYHIILLTGDFIFLWTGKKKMKGVFEAFFIEIRHPWAHRSPKH